MAVVLTEKVVPPKVVIYYQGNDVEEIYFVQQGRVKVARWLQTVAHLGMLLHWLMSGEETASPSPSLHMPAMLCRAMLCRL